MINSKLDISAFSDIFSSEKIVVIPNYLQEEVAKKIYHYIHNQKPKSNWTSTVCVDNVKCDKPYTDNNKKQIKNNIKKANAAFSNNKFSFSFQRSINTNKQPSMEGFTTYIFKQQSVIDNINLITNMNVETAHDVFISKYRFGDFLSPHCDKNNGRVAFVLNLTKDWRPPYGGILHIMNQDRTEIIKSISPTFNNLVLFYIPPEHGIPHFVSHINVEGIYRYGITGWFS